MRQRGRIIGVLGLFQAVGGRRRRVRPSLSGVRLRSSAGPSDRAGFMDAPLTGAAHRIVLTNPRLSTASMTNAWVGVHPGPGSVEPRKATSPKVALSTRAAGRASVHWAAM
jgi:hypothetical protein